MNKKFQAAFTLLEVLISVAIITVVVTGAYLAFGNSLAGEVKNKSHRLLGQLQIAQEESILRGVELGLLVEPDGYSFMIFNNETWQPLEEHPILKAEKLDEPVGLFVKLEGQEMLLQNRTEDDSTGKESVRSGSSRSASEEEKKRPRTPQVYILSSGEMNEFILTLGVEKDEGFFYRIRSNYLGDLKISSRALAGHYEYDWDKDLDEEKALEKERDQEDFIRVNN